MKIKITPALLAEIEQKAESATPGPWAIMYGGQPGDSYAVIGSCTWNRPICSIEPVNYKVENAQHIAAADPATVLAMSKEIKRLWAAQCWAIVTIETGVVDGPYATREAAENERLAELCDDPNEPMYRVEPWKGGA